MKYALVLWIAVWTSSAFAKSKADVKTDAKTKNGATALAEAYENIHHWGGEVGGEETPERIKEINAHFKSDCAEGMALIKKWMKKKTNDPQILGPALLIVDTCSTNVKATEAWIKKYPKACSDAKPYFEKLSPDDNADATSTYSIRCPAEATDLYKKK